MHGLPPPPLCPYLLLPLPSLLLPFVPLLQAGLVVPSPGPDISYTSYVPPCLRTIRVVPKVGRALAAIIIVPVVLMIVMFVLWTKYAKHENPVGDATGGGAPGQG